MIDPIATMHDTWMSVWDHKGLILAIVGAGLVLMLAFFVLRSAFVTVNPQRVAVQRAVKRLKKDAHRTPFVPKVLKTRGTTDRRIGPARIARILGGSPTSSVWLVLLRPSSGLFRWFQEDLLLVARHLVEDADSDTLELRAISISHHGLVQWPNDDLSDPRVRAAWEGLLRNKNETKVADDVLQSRINHWYIRWLGHQVNTQVAIDVLDLIMDNLSASMARDFARRPQATHEIVPATIDNPADPTNESVPRV